MKKNASKTPYLSKQDLALWERVKQSSFALDFRGRKTPAKMMAHAPLLSPQMLNLHKGQMGANPPEADKGKQSHRVRPFLDRLTLKSLAKGERYIEGRLDLHGLYQEEAFHALYSFIRSTHSAGARYVLVVTGKGHKNQGEGVLRRSVPQWFATPLFRLYVYGYEEAAKVHGGSGAIYVQLRR